jgi:glycine/D-amino acid oxidase-like deaminating enzyme
MIRADAVVIGAGAFGAAVAFHLAARGRDVVLVDRDEPVSQTSPRAAGLAVQVRSNVSFARLAQRSVELIRCFEAETGIPLAHSVAGSIAIARTPEHAEHVRRQPELGRRTGLEVRLIEADAARELAPYADPASALAISYTPSDLHLDTPADLPLAYVAAARARGTRVLAHAAVTGVVIERGRVARVVTERGDIRAPIVVDTAGAWAGAVARLAGRELPVVAARHQLLITAAQPEVDRAHPSVRVTDANVYTRPACGGLMLGGYEPDPLRVDPEADLRIADLALDPEPLRRLVDDVVDVFPLLADAQVAELRGGLPTLTADGLFILDHLPGIEGFHVVAGCNVGGLSTSPAVGEAMAERIVDGRPAIDLSPFALGRFRGWAAPEELRRAALLQYARTEFG